MTLDEYRRLMDGVPSAWRGHEEFAGWLVECVRPKLTVELGVNLGFSLFALARVGVGKVVGVDSFEGRTPQDTDDYAFVVDKLPIFYNVQLLKMRFDDARDVQMQRPHIDILHIDGHHHYEAVHNDYHKWSDCVYLDSGVVLMHDTQSFPDGVGRIFREIGTSSSIDLAPSKVEFTHSSGLGVIGPRGLLEEIVTVFPNAEMR